MSRTRSRCRVVLGCGDQDADPGRLVASRRYRAAYVQRESWRSIALGETLLVFTHRNALVKWNELTVPDTSVPNEREIPDLTLRASGPLGAHDEAVFVRPRDEADSRSREPWESILITAAERVAVPLEIGDAEKRSLVVTYCSRRKNPAAGDLAAIERYLSPRLTMARDLAAARGADFRILSGRFGLLKAEDPIPFYDHLLQPDEVAAMKERVMPALGVYDDVVFVQAEGDYVDPYLAVIAGAAAETVTSVTVETIGSGETAN